MFKLDRKLIVSASAVTIAALFTAGCVKSEATAGPAEATYANGKVTIDGGLYYPVVDGKTGPYLVNTQKQSGFTYGRTPTANEIAAWDKDVMPDGTGLPEGSGSVEEGEEIYEAQCVMCHGDFGSGGGGYPALAQGNAYEGQKTLTNQRTTPDKDGPIRVFGTYWPQASTMWWYIQSGMPHPKTKSLSNDETYALTAYMLNLNQMEIDGELVDDDYVLDREKFLKIKMPNEKGFEPNIDGPTALEDVRAYYSVPENFGAQKVKPSERCMTDCQKETAKVATIQNGGISDFLPPISVVRDLPVEEGETVAGKDDYESSCAVCHVDSSMGAPAVGDKAAWEKLKGKGVDAILANAINGFGGMPPRGGTDLSDAKMKDAVDYMINASK
ncbi:MAG: c-type cytochrome [Campylobacterales bacterium]|nr:c-type cytochrome [Campylobacterales bacterium]